MVVQEKGELLKRTVSGMVLMLLLTSMLSSAFNLHSVKAELGTVDPPTLLWMKVYDSGRGDWVYGIAIDSLYNVIIASTAFAYLDEDALTLKFDGSDGNLVWVNTYDIGTAEHPQGVVVDSKDNVITCILLCKIPPQDIHVVKYNSIGDLRWTRVFDYETRDLPYAIATDSMDNIIVAGSYDTDGGDPKLLMAKFDSNGNLLWSRTYPVTFFGGQSPSGCAELVIDRCDNIILGGSTYGDGPYGVYFYVAKFDPDGNLIWERKRDIGGYGYAVSLDSSENVIVTGDAATIKYDYGGNLLWLKMEAGKDLAVDNTGNIIIADGSSMKCLDSNGNRLWNINVDGDLTKVSLDSVNDILVAGNTGTWGDRKDIVIMKYTITPPTLPSTIRVKRLNLHRIDTVDFKLYVKRVLPHEWIASWPIESLKAGAMAAKTYAWYWIDQGGRHPPDADVCDGQHCQRYKEETNPKTDVAVENTWPMGMRKDGKLFESAYWDGLVVVDYTGGAGLKIRSSPELRDDNVIKVVTDGAKLVVVNNTPVSANGFQWWDVVTDSGNGVRGWAAGKYLRSRWPSYQGETLDEYAVKHNVVVRMSQYGSMYLAIQGWDFRQILSYYYPGIEFFDTGGTAEPVEPEPLPAQAAELAKAVIGAMYCHGKGWNWTVTLNEEGKPKSSTWKGSRFLTADEIESGYWYVYRFYNETTKKWEDKVEYGAGLDCSGLIYWSYNKAYGATNYIDRKNPIFYDGAYQQYWLNCLPLKKEELLPGDLLFFDTADPGNPDHVAMYVGGPFQFVYDGDKVFIYNTVESTIWGDGIVTVAFYNSTSETLTTLKPSTGENRTLCVTYYGRVTDHNKKGTKIIAKSPVDLNVTDPDGNVLTKDIGEVAGMFYIECDVNGDGVLDDVVAIPEMRLGQCLIAVMPEPEALPTDTYTLEAWGDATTTLADNILISDIPTEPYILNSTALDIHPTTLLKIGEPKFVTDNMTYLTSATPIMLIAEDNLGGSGIASTLYRIYNATYDTGWIIYIQPFYLTELSDGVYQIDYYSIDNAYNIESTNTATVILDNTPPVASFTWTPSIPKVGETVTFDASASTSGGVTILSYEWGFGDGEHATEKTVTHTYTTAGTYTVTLNVTDSLGFWDIEQKQIQVEALPTPPPLSASTSPLSTSILVGQSVTFTSTVSGGYTPYTYQWYLNGALVSGAPSNTWTFTSTTSGIYYIHLKVTDAKGNTAQSETARITVSTPPVGGYSFPIQVSTKAEPVLPYIALIAILTAILTKLRPKTKRKR